MSIPSLSPQRGAFVGTTHRVMPGETLPPSLFAEGVCLTFGSNPENFYRVKRVLPSNGLELTHLRKREVISKTWADLVSLLPIIFVIPDRGWRSLRTFKEGGIYQVWPTGYLIKVETGGLFVNAVTGERLFGDNNRHVPILFPVMIERWVPPSTASQSEDE